MNTNVVDNRMARVFLTGEKRGGGARLLIRGEAVLPSPSHHPSVSFRRDLLPSLEHQGDDESDDQKSLKQPEKSFRGFPVHDDEGTHTETGREGGDDEDHFFPGKAKKEKAMVQVILVDAGQELHKGSGLMILESGEVDVDHIKDEDAEDENGRSQ
jgi:hypothetical protein